MKISLKIIYLPIIITILTYYSQAQESDVGNIFADDSCLSVGGAITRSVIIPGMGQVYQERLGHGAFFYGASLIFYYNSFFYLYRYNKTDGKNYYNKFRNNLSAALFIHFLNIIDVSDTAINDCPKGWQGALLGDKPIKSPWGAALRSGVLPGWGQLYNDSYLKAV